MSKWFEVTDANDILIEDDEITICLGSDYQGSIYATVPLSVMKDVIKKRGEK